VTALPLQPMKVGSTISQVLATRAAAHPDAPAIVATGLVPLSFAALAEQIEKIGKQFEAAGITGASRVGIALPRGPEAALLSIAACCHATVVPINIALSSIDLRTELERVRLDALILSDQASLPDWASGAGDDCGLFAAARAVSSFEAIRLRQVRPVRRPKPPRPISAQSWAVVFRTSGTTGLPKRVPVTHENLVEMARKMERWLELKPTDRSACIMPLHYNAGFKATLLVPLLAGCSVALPESAAPQDFESWVTELRPTWLTASPAFLQAVVDTLARRAADVPAPCFEHSLRFVLSTASYLSDAIRRDLERLLAVPVVEFYGLCEAGMMTAPMLRPGESKPGSAGRIPQDEVAIRSDTGRWLPAGEPGQVMLRGPSVMPGYLVEDIDGVPTGLHDGWLATGDIGTVDSEGFLTILGRTREIINRGGEKIAPYDVEKALLGHPAVREAAAFAVPHPRLGENVGAAVVLHDGAQATSLQLIDFISGRLAPFQMPRQIHVVASLPVGLTGKISRSSLSSQFAGYRMPAVRPAASLEILIADIWQQRLECADIGMDDDFFQIGGDSLQATEMLLDLEKTTGQRISPSDVRAQLTIRRLCEVLARAAEAKQELLTEVRSGTGTPLFFCHGDFGGWGFYAVRLARLLAHDGPIYLLHSVLDSATGIDSIEEMARRYLPHVVAAAPYGPIRLAGYCHGGLAALEVARQLEAVGRDIEHVILIDTFSINARPAMRALVPAVSRAFGLLPGRSGHKLRGRACASLWRLAIHILAGDQAIASRVTRTVRNRSMQFWDDSRRTTYYQAMSRYLPPPVAADVICLLCDEYRPKKEYAPGPWSRLARSVWVGGIPGDHNTCISRHADELAACINRMLEAKGEVFPAVSTGS
jgi:oxalate---CoA ligase